ncbi:B-cell receptor CD22-like [Xenentodon cancila]
MKEERLVSAALLSVNVVTVNMLLSVFFLSGVLADCDKNPSLFITAPKKIEVFNGSCLQISCNFSVEEGKEFNGSREITGVWLKHDTNLNLDKNNVVFNSSKQNNIYPINITGNMKVKNCTTLFSNLQTKHSDTYYFRIENGPFRSTASCDGVIITVQDSPWRPTINISGDLKENERVTITCSAVTPCPHFPPELTWNLQQDFHTQTEKNNDGTFTTKIQKSITLSDTHDGYNIRCSVRYPVNEGKDFKTSQTEKTLSVSYAPKDTSASISPSGLVSAGSWVKLTCSSRANPPVSSFTWFKKSEDGDMKVAEGDFYILNVTVGGVYYCVATNDVGNQTSADISLNVWKILRYIIAIIFMVGSVCRRLKSTGDPDYERASLRVSVSVRDEGSSAAAAAGPPSCPRWSDCVASSGHSRVRLWEETPDVLDSERANEKVAGLDIMNEYVSQMEIGDRDFMVIEDNINDIAKAMIKDLLRIFVTPENLLRAVMKPDDPIFDQAVINFLQREVEARKKKKGGLARIVNAGCLAGLVVQFSASAAVYIFDNRHAQKTGRSSSRFLKQEGLAAD